MTWQGEFWKFALRRVRWNCCRNFGFGVASCSGRIGGMIAPFFVYIVSQNSQRVCAVNPPRRGSGVLWWACLSVCECLSVRDHILGTTCLIFTKFFVHVWRRSDTLRTSSFMDDVIAKVARRRRPAEAQFTRSLGFGYKRCAVIPVAGQRTHGTAFRPRKVTSQVAATGAQSAVYDCVVYIDAEARQRSIPMKVSVCLSVRSHISETTWSNIGNESVPKL